MDCRAAAVGRRHDDGSAAWEPGEDDRLRRNWVERNVLGYMASSVL